MQPHSHHPDSECSHSPPAQRRLSSPPGEKGMLPPFPHQLTPEEGQDTSADQAAGDAVFVLCLGLGLGLALCGCGRDRLDLGCAGGVSRW